MNDAKPQKTNNKFEKRLAELETAAVNLIKSIAENNEVVNKLTDKVDGLIKVQKETDEHLNAVILMAEKFPGNKNGKYE